MELITNETINHSYELKNIYKGGVGCTKVIITNKRLVIETEGRKLNKKGNKIEKNEFLKYHEIPFKQIGTVKVKHETYSHFKEKIKGFLLFLIMTSLCVFSSVYLALENETFYKELNFYVLSFSGLIFFFYMILKYPFRKEIMMSLYIESTKEQNSLLLSSIEGIKKTRLAYTEENYNKIKDIAMHIANARK